MVNLDPRGKIGRIYIGYHKTLLHTKYINCGPHGFREDFFFLNFPIITLWELMTPGRSLGPQRVDLQDKCKRPLNIATYLFY